MEKEQNQNPEKSNNNEEKNKNKVAPDDASEESKIDNEKLEEKTPDEKLENSNKPSQPLELNGTDKINNQDVIGAIGGFHLFRSSDEHSSIVLFKSLISCSNKWNLLINFLFDFLKAFSADIPKCLLRLITVKRRSPTSS